MNKKTYLIILPLLLLAIGLLAGCIRGVTGDSPGEQGGKSDTHRGADPHVTDGDHVTVDPRVPELLEGAEWAPVFILIGNPPGFALPIEELRTDERAWTEVMQFWDMELHDQLRAERRADVLSVLGTDYQQAGNAGDQITASGLQKLRNHPFVQVVLSEEQDGNSDTHLRADPHVIEDDHVSVDPRLLQLLQEVERVRVNIDIPLPPGFEMLGGPVNDETMEVIRTLDLDLYDRLNAERKAHVVAWLGTDLEQRLPGQWINAAGVEKMRNHPFVRSIRPKGLDYVGEFPASVLD